MKVTDKDVAYVADLANLELSEEERGAMLCDLNSILGHIDRLSELQISELQIEDVAPTAQVSDTHGVERLQSAIEPYGYAFREDVKEGLRKSLPQEIAVKNAPDTDGKFFVVPKVIER